MDPVFLTFGEVLEMHAEQIERYGGVHGLRDRALLESAIAMPQSTFYGEWLHPTVPAMAAAYLFHLCQNHPFFDGNKRTGANAAIVFLFLNDWELDLSEAELVDLVLSVADGRIDKAQLTWVFGEQAIPIPA